MKNLFRRNLSLLILMIITTIALVGCGGGSTTTTEAKGIFKPGTYTAITKSHGGDLKIEVEFDKDKIVAIKIVEQNDSDGVVDTAFNPIIEKILEAQSAEVEPISSATVSSNALMAAVQDAINQAKN